MLLETITHLAYFGTFVRWRKRDLQCEISSNESGQADVCNAGFLGR
jgi:hypothetical protein